MFIQVPADMDEVQLRQLQLKQHGETVTESAIINQAVLDIFQNFLDQIEDGHYDTATWQGNDLVVTDIDGRQTATVSPAGASFEADFRDNADQTEQRLEQEAIRAAGGR
ncbi:peptidase dimerization domain-containing protein [Levilactobacillus senmaizukei]|nr:peptidase dimerization domain-containing protein [Levilactobacillus senmaizukei]